MVVAGGFTEAAMVKSSDLTLDLSMLEGHHEEADAYLILHCVHAHMESQVVLPRDTDILVLLLAHYDKMDCGTLMMKAATLKQPNISQCMTFIIKCQLTRYHQSLPFML